jgi:hypothetical protein
VIPLMDGEIHRVDPHMGDLREREDEMAGAAADIERRPARDRCPLDDLSGDDRLDREEVRPCDLIECPCIFFRSIPYVHWRCLHPIAGIIGETGPAAYSPRSP